MGKLGILIMFLTLISCSNSLEFEKESEFLNIQDKILYYKGKIYSGELIYRYPDGAIEMIQNYKDGLMEGVSEGFYNDGQLKERANCKKGLLSGNVQWYYQNGQQERTCLYQDSKIVKCEDFYEDGQLKSKEAEDGFNGYKEFFNDGRMNFKDVWKIVDDVKFLTRFKFNEFGDTISWANYTQGQLDGIVKTILNDKGEYSIENYKKGKLVGRKTKFTAEGVKIKEGITPLSEATLDEVQYALRKSYQSKGSYLEVLTDSKFRMQYHFERDKYPSYGVEYKIREGLRKQGYYAPKGEKIKYDLIIKGDYRIYKTGEWTWNTLSGRQPRNDWGEPMNSKKYYGFKVVFSGYDDYGKFHTMCGDITQVVRDNNEYKNKWELSFTRVADGCDCATGDWEYREAIIPKGFLREL